MSGNKTRIEALREAETLGDVAVANWVHGVFSELQDHKWRTASGTNHATWNRWLDIYDGSQILDKEERPAPKHNMTQQLIEETKPTLIEVGVDLEAFPRQQDDDGKATQIQDYIDYGKDAINLEEKDRAASNWLLKIGSFVGKVYHNPDAFNGLGAPEVAILDPRTVFFDEYAKDVESASIILTANVVDLEALVSRFPKHADKLRSSDHSNLDYDRAVRTGSDPLGLERGKKFSNARSALVIEMWLRDPKVDRDTGLELPEPKPVYPYGRVITVAGDVVLADRKNPFDPAQGGHGKFPFFMAQCVDNEEGPWGKGWIELLEPDQLELDALESMISTYTRLASMPWIVIPKSARIKVTTIKNRPGIVLQPQDEKSAGAIDFKVPPPLPAHVYQRASDLPERMRKRIGGGEIDVSVVTNRTQPVGTLEIVKDTAEKRPRAIIDNKNKAWAKCAKLMLGLFRQFMSDQRAVRIAGNRDTVLDPSFLRDVEIESFDIRIIPSGRTIRSRALTFAMAAELDKMGVLGAPDAPRRRRFLAEQSGVKGAVTLLNEEEQEAALQAAMAEMMPPPMPEQGAGIDMAPDAGAGLLPPDLAGGLPAAEPVIPEPPPAMTSGRNLM